MDHESFGDRLRRYRQRAGMSRPVLGGLVGRSAE
ncbi:MAG: helix-turn-helix domain-containing protein, partial [Micromonosporaceae bacterium]